MGEGFADWGAVFGAAWFWATALLFWAGAASGLAGVPRGLIADAQTGAGEAALARSLARYRLSRGARLAGPLATPIAGAGGVYLAFGAATGGAFELAALTALGPVLALRLAIEPTLRAATALEPDAAAKRFDQLWRAQFGAVAFSAAATVAAAALTAPVGRFAPPIFGQ